MLQVVATQTMRPEGIYQCALCGRQKFLSISLAKVRIYVKERVHGLKKQELVCGDSVVLDEFAVYHMSGCPGLEPLAVGKPCLSRYCCVVHVSLKYL